MFTNNIVLSARRSNVFAFSSKFFLSVLLLFSLFAFQIALGQGTRPVCTKPNGSVYLPHCTSNDLSVVGAFLTASSCSCTEGTSTTATLNFKLANKTGSFRTSFAFYANLVQTTSSGTTTTYLTRCKAGVPAGEVSTITFDEPITFTCGATLKLTDVYLAWTDASDGRVCPLAFCDIAPKCGTPQDITITSLLSAKATTVTSCDNSPTGSCTVTPSGGTAPYDIIIAKKTTTSCPSTPITADIVATYTDVTTAPTKTGLAAGAYCIYVTDAASTPCTYTFSTSIASKTCCVNPPKPTVCEVPQSNLCPDVTNGVTIKVSNLQAGAYYTVTQGTAPNFTYNQTKQQTGSVTELTFTGLATGAGLTVYGEDQSSTPYCKGTEATCADITPCSTTGGIVNSNSFQSVDMVPQTRVMAAPNPFNDRIRFTLESDVSGQGTLELYNLQGQKVKTVYQGYIEKGLRQNIEYSVPFAQRSALIYMFRVGNQKASGKLLGIKQ